RQRQFRRAGRRERRPAVAYAHRQHHQRTADLRHRRPAVRAGGRGRHALCLCDVLTRMRIRYGMVGGGEGAFIGAVHRMAARLDDEWELVCGAFSGDAEKSRRSGATLALPRERVYATYEQMMASEAALDAEE